MILSLFVAKDIVVDGGYYDLGRVARDHPLGARLHARTRVTALLGYYVGAATSAVSTSLRLVQYGIAVFVVAGLVYLRKRLRA